MSSLEGLVFYALVTALVITLASLGYAGFERVKRQGSEARAEKEKADASAARDERDRATRLSRSLEKAAEEARGKAVALDLLLTEKTKRERTLENDKLSLKGSYDDLRKKLDSADLECLARTLPPSIADRLRGKP